MTVAGPPQPTRGVEVRVDLTSLRNADGLLTGRVHLAADGEAFPNRDWDDFLWILGDWYAELRAGAGGRLRFADGPFHAVLDERERELRLFEHDRLVGVVSDVERSSVEASCLQAIRAVLTACVELGWEGDDVEALRERVGP